MTLGKIDGRTLADFMPASQAGQGQRPGRRGQPGSRRLPSSTAITAQQGVAVNRALPGSSEDLPPHLRKH